MSKTSLFLAYVTSGREKYVFTTNIIGIYTDKRKALQETFCYLVDDGLIFDEKDADSDDENDEQKEYTKAVINMDNISDIKRLETYLQMCVKKYNNTYYKNGWTYTIKLQDVNKM
jgi:hypothetical protein